MKRILFLGIHRIGKSPSQRFRFEQYLTYLATQGYQCDFSFLVSRDDEQYYHHPGHYLRKIWIGIKAFTIRMGDVLRMNRYDIIFIPRRAFLTEWMFFEKLFRKSKAKLVFDIDDAVWIDAISDYNKRFAWIKGKSNTTHIMKMVDRVFAGNNFLANYALKFNSDVVVIPTTIDTDLHVPAYQPAKQTVIIGWSGSFSTIQHFRLAIPVLKKLKIKYGDKIGFKVIGDRNYADADLNIQGHPWMLETEVPDLQEIDIGIMPLPDTEWAQGKCGLKGLSYMALEIPTIMSPVGVNKEIIQHGENGFLCGTDEAWFECLSELIDHADLRVKIGKAGRETVLKKYSVNAIKNQYKKYLDSLIPS